jgi:hypothetical protein
MSSFKFRNKQTKTILQTMNMQWLSFSTSKNHMTPMLRYHYMTPMLRYHYMTHMLKNIVLHETNI